MKKILFLLLMLSGLNLFGQSEIQVMNLQVVKGSEFGVEYLYDQNTTTGWFPGWNDYPVQVLISFDQPYYFQTFEFFDMFGDSKISLYGWENTTKIQLVNTTANLFQSWNIQDIIVSEKRFQYLVLEIIEPKGQYPINEIRFKGSLQKPPKQPTPINLNKLKGASRKIGSNGFHWIPTNKHYLPFLRQYQMLQWTWTPSGIAVEPTREADGNYDAYLTNAKRNGQTVVICPNKWPNWKNTTNLNDPEWGDRRWHELDANPTDPKSYTEVAAYFWQIAARFGSKKHSEDKLCVNETPRWNGDPINTKKSGLNILQYIEVENEPDRPWKDAEHKYTPEQYAALLSACYDGHCGTLGPNVGIKDADPNMKVVFGGLSAINIVYIEKVRQWCIKNRPDKKFPSDIVNVHHYCNKSNPPYPAYEVNLYKGSGIPPEQDFLYERLMELVQYTHSTLPKNTEVWYSEFGYDTEPCQTDLCNYAGQFQAEWIVRTYLTGLAANVEKMMVYNGVDENNTTYLFGSSGLVTSQVSGYKPKPAYQKVQQLVNQLHNQRFSHRTVLNNNIFIYTFKGPLQTTTIAYYNTTADKEIEFVYKGKIFTSTPNTQYYNFKLF